MPGCCMCNSGLRTDATAPPLALAPHPGLPTASVSMRGRCPVTQVGPWGDGLSLGVASAGLGEVDRKPWCVLLWPSVGGLGAESHGAEAVCSPQCRGGPPSSSPCDSISLTGTQPSPRALRQAWSPSTHGTRSWAAWGPGPIGSCSPSSCSPTPMLSAELLSPLWPKTCSLRRRAGGEQCWAASVGGGGFFSWRPRKASVFRITGLF